MVLHLRGLAPGKTEGSCPPGAPGTTLEGFGGRRNYMDFGRLAVETPESCGYVKLPEKGKTGDPSQRRTYVYQHPS